MTRKRISLGVDWYVANRKKPILTSTKAESDLIVCLQEKYGDLPSILEAHKNKAIMLNGTELKIIKTYVDLGYKNINIE